MTKEEVAKEILARLVKASSGCLTVNVCNPHNGEDLLIDFRTEHLVSGEEIPYVVESTLQSAIVEAITRYIRATVPQCPIYPDPLNLVARLIADINYLERQILFLMDEGNVYEQGRNAAKAEWEDERKELVELLRQCEWSGREVYGICPICKHGNEWVQKSHAPGCRLALAIGAKRREQ